MDILRVDARHPDPAIIARAAERICAGALVAFPTETVYGLGADALNAEAVAGIFAAKGRPAWNPVIAHVASVADAETLVRQWTADADRLADAFWPGPLTLVLHKHARVPDVTTAGLDCVGVRLPAHPVAQALLAAAGRPIAAPSANRFTGISPTTAAHVVASLGDQAGLVLDGGPCDVGIESTVLDLSSAIPTILRPGMVSRAAIESLLGRPVAQLTPGRGVAVTGETRAQRAPGQAVRHYAPQADVWLFEGGDMDRILAAVNGTDARQLRATNRSVEAFVISDDVAERLTGTAARVRRMPVTPGPYAAALYAALHETDVAGVDLLLIERPPATDLWTAVHDRLTRAGRR